jgi:hypothetical protein
VKVYIRDLKRKIKALLQIQESGTSQRSTSAERTHSTTTTSTPQSPATPMTPTIIVQKFEQTNAPVAGDSSSSNAFFSGRHHVSSEQNWIKQIDTALNAYLQASAFANSFDLNKIVDDVKQQLWSTLVEYPTLCNSAELNSYISESVKTCWALANHEPPLKLDYTATKFNVNMHERIIMPNNSQHGLTTTPTTTKSDQIANYVWPALVNTSDNCCLAKAIVVLT